ncbi:hypothetical protein BDZ85DRAFT_108279 [Elsinoe ampelina]|uniref:Uncharacterized protein n=1 Tax=Elsinoe ampelina TaxID=302913 RepID=A0A6A6GCC2_9PEZI|nr:hypothetical protein BDZ85DRAFT_108279 [Elsinoe ampelina]
MPSLAQIPEVPEESREPVSPLASDYPRSEGSMEGRRTVNFSRPRQLFSPSTSNPPSALASPTLEKSPTFENSPFIDHAFRPQLRINQTYQSQSSHESRDRDHESRDGDKTPPARYDTDNQSYDDDDDAAPFPVIRTYADRQELPFNLQSNNPQTWIYKPYADSVVSSRDSDADSTMSEETMTTNDTDSIAESTTTGYSEASDFAFDGRMGWNPTQRPSQAERERQRWAAPVVRPPQEERQRSFNPNTGYRDRDDYRTRGTQSNGHATTSSNRESWLSDSSNGTATTRGSNERPGVSNSHVDDRHDYHANVRSDVGSNVTAHSYAHANAQSNSAPITRKAHRDIFEAAAERKGSLHAPVNGAPGQLARSGSNATDQANRPNNSRRPTALSSNASRFNSSNGTNGMPRPSHVSSNSSSSLNSEDWRGSEVDISALSPEKIKKLEKKGINPALYLEMKQARGGGKKKSGFVGVLTGNSFLS